MGIFNTFEHIRSGNQKITKKFLKELGFEKIYWGSVSCQGKKDFECYEKYIEADDAIHSATLYYFPTGFKGYVTDYNSKGIDPCNKVMGWPNIDDSDEIHLNANCKFDILFSIDKLKQKINKY